MGEERSGGRSLKFWQMPIAAALLAAALTAAPRVARANQAPEVALSAASLAPRADTALTNTPAAAAETTTVILLGTGTPVPNSKAQGPATAVLVGRRLFLFDAGPGVMRQMDAAGLPVRGGPVTALFLTHLHSDHTLGLPDLLLTSWVMGRSRPLRIYGPVGTRRMCDHLFSAWSEDIRVRTEGLEHDPPGGYAADVHEIAGGVVYDSGGVTVRAIRVPHGSWKWAFAYRIDTPGKSVLISGDTSPSAALEQAARGVDVLIHEAYPESRLAPEPRPGGEDWVRYMRSFHTSDLELGALAARAGPKRLVLYHIVRMGGSDEELFSGIRAGGFGGITVIAHDLDRF